jgi:acylphosphatase
MSRQATLHAVIYGMVQGVNFRIFVLRHAQAMGLTGYVRNLPKERAVEVMAEGEREKLEQLLRHIEVGPRLARVRRVDVNWSEYSGGYSQFRIGS